MGRQGYAAHVRSAAERMFAPVVRPSRRVSNLSMRRFTIQGGAITGALLIACAGDHDTTSVTGAPTTVQTFNSSDPSNPSGPETNSDPATGDPATSDPATSEPGSTSAPTSGSSDPSGDPTTNTTTEGCPPGTLTCPCDGGSCEGGLSCVDGFCAAAGCGNGTQDRGEECDDGDLDDSDECTAACTIAAYDDGSLYEGFEECDLSGSNNNTGACKLDCTLQTCGDGFKGPGEACDDGNAVNNDACSNSCVPGGCGDGVVQGGEACDDGDLDDTDACLSTCVKAKCGDGKLYAGVEQCDDGDLDDGDACLNTCKTAKCGDGKLYVGVEDCDDGNAVNGDACSNTCKKNGAQVLIGQFDVNSGPYWGDNPPTYTCKEACALLFGGVAANYSCSVSGVTVTGTAYLSGYGDTQYCVDPQDDDYKLNTKYNCGVNGCSYSAYVQDNCNNGTAINYCWKP